MNLINFLLGVLLLSQGITYKHINQFTKIVLIVVGSMIIGYYGAAMGHDIGLI
jgi:hypothetical protein